MSKTNPKVDAYLKRQEKWQAETARLRSIMLDCGLTEELKWGKPCYSFEDSNVVVLQGFKEYCAALFPKGVLLKDPKHILIQQTENVQAARQLRFTSLKEIVALESAIKAYVRDAIEVEKSGQKITLKKTSEFEMPEEFRKKLDGTPSLKKAFEALTPGRQRGYLLYFSGAKQATTREARIEKCAAGILQGKGLND